MEGRDFWLDGFRIGSYALLRHPDDSISGLRWLAELVWSWVKGQKKKTKKKRGWGRRRFSGDVRIPNKHSPSSFATARHSTFYFGVPLNVKRDMYRNGSISAKSEENRCANQISFLSVMAGFSLFFCCLRSSCDGSWPICLALIRSTIYSSICKHWASSARTGLLGIWIECQVNQSLGQNWSSPPLPVSLKDFFMDWKQLRIRLDVYKSGERKVFSF